MSGKVLVKLINRTPNGGFNLGNTIYMDVNRARDSIGWGIVKAPGHRIGVIPDSWPEKEERALVDIEMIHLTHSKNK